jgi:hypothetical protein
MIKKVKEFINKDPDRAAFLLGVLIAILVGMLIKIGGF